MNIIQNLMKTTVTIMVLITLLTSCQKTADTVEEIPIITIGRQTVVFPKLPKGDTYEDNAYTRLIEAEFNIDLQSEFEVLQSDYQRRVSQCIATKELPDIMMIDTLDELLQLHENDLIADLSSVYNEYATPGIKAKYDSYNGKCLDDVTFNDKMLALPGTSLLETPTMVWIRSDWLDDLNIEIDTDNDRKITIKEIELVAREFVNANLGEVEIPVGIATTTDVISQTADNSYCLNQIAYAMNAMPKTWYLEDNELIYGSTTQETLKFLMLMNNWFEDGILDPQFATRTWDDIQNLLINGSTGIAFGAWHLPDWGLNQVYENDKNATFEAYALENDIGKIYSKHNKATCGYIVVSKDCKYPEIAVHILNLLNDDELIEKSAVKYPEIAEYQKLAVDGSTRPFNIVVVSATSLLDDYYDITNCLNNEISFEQVKTLESKATILAIRNYKLASYISSNSEWAKYHSRLKGISLFDTIKNDDDYIWLSPIIPKNTKTIQANNINLSNIENEFFIQVILGLIDPITGFEEFKIEIEEAGLSNIKQEINQQIFFD